MTREEQILEAFINTPGVIDADNPCFIWDQACKWADAHPKEVICIDDRAEIKELKNLLEEAKDILESVAMANGFVIPFRAKEWLENIKNKSR